MTTHAKDILAEHVGLTLTWIGDPAMPSTASEIRRQTAGDIRDQVALVDELDASTEPTFMTRAADCGHRGSRDRIAPTIITHTRQKQSQCQDCGCPLTLAKVFEETYCGWNTLYMDGRSKTPDTIKADLTARAEDWEPPRAWCEWCLTREDLAGEVSWSKTMLQHAETDGERSHYQARIEYFRVRLDQHTAPLEDGVLPATPTRPRATLT